MPRLILVGPDRIRVELTRLEDGRVRMSYREWFEPGRATDAQKADTFKSLESLAAAVRGAPHPVIDGDWIGWDADFPHDGAMIALSAEILLMNRREIRLG